MNYFNHYMDYLALAFGFGFVIFFHELGHFLAAKYCDVKVEQFAVGFGPAIFSWRKGLGMRWGSSGKEFDDLRRFRRRTASRARSPGMSARPNTASTGSHSAAT